MMFEKTRDYLERIGMPTGDLHDLPTSSQTFDDDSHFRIEVASINTVKAAEAILKTAEENKVVINRITATLGLFLHTSDEIRDYVELTSSYGTQLVMAIGPRAKYDTSATAQTSEGKSISYRLRGQEQIVRAVEEVYRALELGVKNFVIYDEGLLWLLNKMRQDGHLDKEITFKMSAHCGHGNPATMKLLEKNGANSINPVRDLELPMIAALRHAVNVPLDVHTDNPVSSGGFIRFYEAPEIIRIASPVHLKVGNSVLEKHGQILTIDHARMIVRNVIIVLEFIERNHIRFNQSINIIR